MRGSISWKSGLDVSLKPEYLFLEVIRAAPQRIIIGRQPVVTLKQGVNVAKQCRVCLLQGRDAVMVLVVVGGHAVFTVCLFVESVQKLPYQIPLAHILKRAWAGFRLRRCLRHIY